MKMLKKLALVSAVSMISAGAFAMEAMDDESMSATTGQDGITILISPASKTGTQLAALGVSNETMALIDGSSGGPITNNGATQGVGTNNAFKGLSIAKIVIHDDDGLENSATLGGNANTVNSGALVIGSGGTDSTVVFADDGQAIEVKLDMVGNIAGGAGNAPMLNIAITTPRLGIKLGDIYVANSNASEVGFNADGVTTPANTTQIDGTAAVGDVAIISGFEIVMGGATTVIQLGNEAQGAMVRANTSIIGGLTINNFELIDANGLGAVADSGSIQVGSLVMKDNGGANLTVDARINVSNGTLNALGGEGLYITLAAFGSATGADLSLNNVALGASGTTNVLGDIQIIGLDLAGTTMIIRGH